MLYSLLLSALVCLPGAAAGQTVADPPTARLGGYVQFDYLAPLGDRAEADQTFRFRRVRLLLTGTFAPHIDYAVTAEATSTPVLRDAYIAFTYLPAASIRVGQFIMPYGLEQFVFSSNTLEFTERLLTPMVPARDAGVMISNRRPFGGWLTYAAAITNGTGMNVRDNNDAKDAVVRLTAAPPRIAGLQVSLSAASGEQPNGLRTRRGGDIRLERRRYHLAAEFENERTEGVSSRRGGYVFGSWRLYPAAPTPFFHHLELGSRYARIAGEGGLAQWEASVNYYAAPTLRFMCDFIVHTRRLPGAPRSTLHARANIRF
jgi:phosphate-selective porin